MSANFLCRKDNLAPLLGERFFPASGEGFYARLGPIHRVQARWVLDGGVTGAVNPSGIFPTTKNSIFPACFRIGVMRTLLDSMRLVGSDKIKFGLSVLLALSGMGQSVLRAATTMSADEVIQKAVGRSQHTQTQPAAPGYTYTKVTVTEELDATGKVKERKEKVYQVAFQAGSSHLKLLEVNGHAPPDAEVKKQSENETNLRLALGKSKSDHKDNRENFLTPELVARFNFTLVGKAPLNGRPAYEISFQPKNPEPPAHHVVDRLLNRISGTVWIDADEFEIARADIHLRSEVNLLGGVIGSLKKLAYTMTRTRLADGVWFNTSSSGDFEGRKLIDSMRIKTKSQSSNFRPVRLGA